MAIYSEQLLQRRRLSGLVALLGLIGVIMVGRLFALQVLKHGYYQALGARIHLRKYEICALLVGLSEVSALHLRP